MKQIYTRKLLITVSLATLVLSSSLFSPAWSAPKVGLPGRREPAGTRTGATCVAANQKPLIAITPESNIGLTLVPYPTFFWYVPENYAKALEFVLVDEGEKEVYKTTFAPTGSAGVISLSLPATIGLAPLKVAKPYRWYFSIVCDPADRSSDLLVKGVVQRVAPTAALVETLQRSEPRKRLEAYAAAGIWNDLLATLAELRRTYPSDSSLSSDWALLLKQVKLDDYAREPLVDSRTANQSSTIK